VHESNIPAPNKNARKRRGIKIDEESLALAAKPGYVARAA